MLLLNTLGGPRLTELDHALKKARFKSNNSCYLLNVYYVHYVALPYFLTIILEDKSYYCLYFTY